MSRASGIAACALLLLAPAALRAANWISVTADSELRFAAYYEGERLPGRFESFTVSLKTAAGADAPTALTVEVDTGSADMNDREINAEIDEPEWFAVEAFPAARFESDEIRPSAEGYVAAGRLRLKGVERPLEIPLSWSRDGDSARLSGSIRMSRQAWRIGTGEWSGDASLSDRVDVEWRVRLVPAE